LQHRQDALLDQRAATLEQMDHIAQWLDDVLNTGAHVAVHCMAGLGRSGMVAASYLTRTGMRADAAISLVREKRSPRAVETAVQEEFVHKYAAHRE
jgi:protein-tyrosine phosphatase